MAVPPASSESPSGPDPFLERCREVLREHFGFEAFRPGQEHALRAMGAGRDGLFVMPTGSGKSICYQVPALLLPGVTLVVSPLIALMKDQVDGLRLRGIPATCINSTVPWEEQRARLEGLREGRYRLVYVAPERFRNRAFRRALGEVRVSLLAVDEAHCISQWGHDFRPDYRRLRDVRAQLGGAQAVALTATATPDVQQDIARQLGMEDPERVVTGFDRPNLRYRVERVRGSGEKLEALDRILHGLIADGRTPSGIVYCGTRRRAEEVAAYLNDWPRPGAEGPFCRAYHAGFDDDERREVQEGFMDGRIPCVAATNAFGMGVDKADIRFVVHHDLPGSIESYYQEVGRAGRDGGPAECVLLFDERDRGLREFFIEGANPDRATVERTHAFLLAQGENPIFRTLVSLQDAFERQGLLTSSNGMAFRSAVSILEHAGALQRLDHYEPLAEIAPRPDRDWLANPYPKRAHLRRRLWDAVRALREETEGEPASVHLESWARDLGTGEEPLRRGLHHLQDEGWLRFTSPFRGRAIRLPDPPAPLEIDFDALERKRRREEERLQRMLGFARSETCRRDYVLAYFGEEVPGESCGRCDACTRGPRRPATSRALDEHEFLVVRKVLSGAARARGRCGRGRIADMLLGSRAREVQNLRLHELSTWGLLRGARKKAVRDLLDRLEEAGCVRTSGEARRPVLQLTEKGLRVMKDEERVEIAFPPGLAVGRPSRSADDGDAVGRGEPAAREDLSASEEELFERLRRLRREVAEELGIPAYRVFHDRTLIHMARMCPASEAEMRAVPGVGRRTFERFGRAFLEELCRELGADRPSSLGGTR